MQHEMQYKTGSKTLQYTRLAIMFQHKSKAFFVAISGVAKCCKMLQRKLKNTAILLAFVSLKLPKNRFALTFGTFQTV